MMAGFSFRVAVALVMVVVVTVVVLAVGVVMIVPCVSRMRFSRIGQTQASTSKEPA